MSYCIPEHVQARPIHDEIMILDANQDRYLGLNGTGAIVWEILADGKSLDAAIDEIASQYEIPRETAASDVTKLVHELLELNLITPVTS